MFLRVVAVLVVALVVALVVVASPGSFASAVLLRILLFAVAERDIPRR